MRTVITSVLITLILPLSATATSTKVDYTPWTVPISGAITANTTWSASSTYIVDGTVTVNAGVTLKIKEGTVVKFKDTASRLIVSGTLVADSNASSTKIYFTSYKDDAVGGDTNGDGVATSPAAGNWRYVLLNSGSTVNLGHTVVRYGGYSGSTYVSNIYNNGGTLTVATSTIAYANVYGIKQAGGTTVISGSNIYGNGTYGAYNALTSTSTFTAINNYWGAASGPTHATLNPFGTGEQITSYIAFNQWLTSAPQIEPVAVKSGTISSDEIWDSSVGVYVVDGTLTVGAGATLTIKNSVVVKFKTATSGIVVNGTLNADSAASSTKIYFTSYKDDSVGGDTNGDGSATSPSAGDWNGVKVNDAASSTLAFVVVRYAGYQGDGGTETSIWNDGGIIMIRNSEIATGTSYGVYNSLGSDGLDIGVSDIHDHGTGIYTMDSTEVWIHSNNIHGNSSYGIYNFSFFNINAEYNYWGASTGPSSVGPGSGDHVSNDVDYTPWLDQVHYLSFFQGALVTSVSSGVIDWNWYSATSTYKDAWYGGLNTWNVYGNSVGGATIATSTTATSSADLLVLDIASSTSDYFVGAFFQVNSAPDLLKFNPYFMNQRDSNGKQRTATHELGHAFGLGHSYIGNVMLSYSTTTGQISLGLQDMLDYDYCWVSNNCIP